MDKEPDLKNYPNKYKKDHPVIYNGTFQCYKNRRYIFGYEQMGQRNCFCKRPQPWPLLECRAAANFIFSRLLAEKGNNNITVFEQLNIG